MNKLPVAKRAQILSMLCEGSSMRAITRITGVSLNTVTKLLIDAGKACDAYHDEHVRGVKATRVQCDEIWAFCYSKQKNVMIAKAAPEGAGDVWTWTALECRLEVDSHLGSRRARRRLRAGADGRSTEPDHYACPTHNGRASTLSASR